MMKRKYWLFAFLILAIGVGCLACKNTDSNETEEGEIQIYQSNPEGTALESYPFQTKVSKIDRVEYIDAMLEEFKNLDVIDYQLVENQITLHLSSTYLNYKGIDEILLRASVVKTLLQLEDVEYVEFYVDDAPLTMDGKVVGVMSELSFMDQLGQGGHKNRYVTLYYAGEKGDTLEEVTTEISFDTTKPMEEILIEKLGKDAEKIGSLQDSTYLNTIPVGTKVNSVSTRDNTCYVDFSEEFLGRKSDVTNEVTIYSIVNTLCELSDINKVQFTVGGHLVKQYGTVERFDQAFERNLNLVDVTSKG